jgi:hypothetical protein
MSRTRFSRRQVLTYAGAAGVASVIGVGRVAAEGTGEYTIVRVAHFSPDAPNVDVYVDDERVLSDVAFGAITDYLTIQPGSREIRITAAGDPDTVAFEGTVDFASTAYTVVATGELTEDSFEPLVLKEGTTRPEEGTTRVRLVHASPDAPAVDVTVGDGETTLFDGVSFGEVTDYVTVPGGMYTLEVRADGNEDAGPVATLDTPLNNTRVYTVFAGGYLTPDDEPAHTPFRLEVDREYAVSGDETDEPDDAGLRVVHASPDAPNVDVYLDGKRVLSDVPFGTLSGFLDVPPGTYEATITAAGDPDTVAFEGEVTLEPDTDYTVTALGELTEETFEPLVTVEDDSPLKDDEARVRLIHASPDAPAVDVTVGDGETTLFDDVSFGEASDYVTVAAGDYDLEVRPADGGDPVAEIPASVEGGTVYTAVAAGYLTPDDEPADEPFTLLVGASDAEDETK